MASFKKSTSARQILEEIMFSQPFRKEARDGINRHFENRKNELMQNFDAHPITQEVRNPNSENISNTLGGYGNLYGFLGIAGGDPTQEVRSVLSSSVKIKKISISKAGISVSFSVPDLKDFSSAAKLEWDTKNWVEGMERGISGFQYFMNVKKGRSGQGVQVRAGIRSGQFKNKKYMSELLSNFKKSLSVTGALS